MQTDLNVLLWRGLSMEAIDAIEELRREGLIHYYPCAPLVYWCDGRVPSLPIVGRRPPSGGYKKLHWAPVTLRPGFWIEKKKGNSKTQ
jgi:hypothetical protein